MARSNLSDLFLERAPEAPAIISLKLSAHGQADILSPNTSDVHERERDKDVLKAVGYVAALGITQMLSGPYVLCTS